MVGSTPGRKTSAEDRGRVNVYLRLPVLSGRVRVQCSCLACRSALPAAVNASAPECSSASRKPGEDTQGVSGSLRLSGREVESQHGGEP